MKFGQIAIGSILFIEAILLLYSPQQRFNLHSFLEQVKQLIGDCQCWKDVGYEFGENVRYFVVAMIISGAYSLILGNNVIMGILAQLLWTVTQSELYYDQGIKEVRNTLVQFLFFVILVGELRDDLRQCKKRREQLKRQQQLEQQRLAKLSQEEGVKKTTAQQISNKKGGKGENQQGKIQKTEEKESKKSK